MIQETYSRMLGVGDRSPSAAGCDPAPYAGVGRIKPTRMN
jgi:hypothetical protein